MQYFIKPKVVVAGLSVKTLKEFNIGKNVLVLVSNSVNKHFKLDTLFSELSESKNLFIYNHIKPNAPFKDLDLIISDLKDKEINTILAIGGGSIIDAAKALSVSFEGVDYKDIFYKKAEMPTNKINVIAVPTTAGTGAELSFGAIIYDNFNIEKGGIRGEIIQPNQVLIDANLHNAGSLKLKAEVGFDCLTHAVETYISQKSNALVRNQSVLCIQNIFKYLISACKDNDFYAMEKVAISSALMGINLAYSSTCMPHRIQYVIGPLTNTSHAQGLIALYKGWLKHIVTTNLKEFNNLVKDLGLDVDTFLKKIQFLKDQLHIDYSLTDLGVKENQIDEICNKVKGNLAADPSYKDINTIKNILTNSL